MAVNTITWRLQDSESDVKRAPFPVYVPTGFTIAQYQAVADIFSPLVDAVSGSQLVSVDMSLALTLPGSGIKTTPDTGSLNERGGLVGMSNAGQWDDSFRIPAIRSSIMSGDEFSIADTDIDALISAFLLGSTTVVPRTRDGFTWTAGLYGKKSFRRK